jgi:formate dehydrogenase gamma subunit
MNDIVPECFKRPSEGTPLVSQGRGRRALPVLLLNFCLSAVALPQAKNSPPPSAKQDQACLACHGQAGMKSEKGKDISILPEKHAASAHGILACTDCHTNIKDFPHPAKTQRVACATCHAEEAADVPKSIHAALGAAACSSCHGNVHEIAPAVKLVPQKCAECHSEIVKDLAASIHGKVAKLGDSDAPSCASCHGGVHKILGSGDPDSAVAKKHQTAVCAQCHADAGFLTRHQIPIAHPVEQYLQSVHGKAVLQGKEAAVCADCHGAHKVLPSRDPQSSVSRWNVAETCGKCHTSIAKTYLESVHGQAIKAGAADAPNCADCHGEHLILGPSIPESPVNALRVSAETCGRCHGDARLAKRYNLPADRVPSYAESFHGLASREGLLTAANCASCHGVHNIFRSNDPRSTVNAANLAKTCGQCHSGMSAQFAIGPVHVQIAGGPAHPIVMWIRGIYLFLIPATLGFMILHNLLDWLAKLLRPHPRPAPGRQVVRMNLWFRIAHWAVMVSFPTLVFTGFALKYPDSWWSEPFLHGGRSEAFRGQLHRAAAIVLIAATLYHFLHLALNRRDRAFLRAMLPRVKDARDLMDVLLFNVGRRQQAPQFGKFNYAEKVEYWAFLWGTAVMAVSGFLLWFNNISLRHLPKWTTDAATAVHWYEALLATFSILLWHFYMVIFDPLVYPMDLAWLNGKVPAEHYERTRPDYLKTLLSQETETTPAPHEAEPEPLSSGNGKGEI